MEQLNTISNFALLAVIIIWSFKTRLDIKNHPLTVLSLPVIFIRFIEGTIYHAFHMDNIFLIPDVYPIAFLAIFVSFYLWMDYFKGKFLKALIAIFASTLFYSLIFFFLPKPYLNMIRPKYIFLGLLIIVPGIFSSISKFNKVFKWLLFSLLAFAVALAFRQLDKNYSGIFFRDTGTHFLWHIFGALSVHFALHFIYLIEKPLNLPAKR